MRRGGRVYVVLASLLIASVVVVYFAAVFPEVREQASRLALVGIRVNLHQAILTLQVLSRGSANATCHLTGGLFCLLNVIFNYVQCIATDPGSTEVLDAPVMLLPKMSVSKHRQCITTTLPNAFV